MELRLAGGAAAPLVVNGTGYKIAPNLPGAGDVDGL